MLLAPAGDATEISEEVVAAYQNDVLGCRAGEFDGMMALRNAIWCIHTGERQSVTDMKCSCPSFLKKNVCKHVLGVASLLGLLQFPVEVVVEPLGQKRKRGRPMQTRPALCRQPDESVV